MVCVCVLRIELLLQVYAVYQLFVAICTPYLARFICQLMYLVFIPAHVSECGIGFKRPQFLYAG